MKEKSNVNIITAEAWVPSRVSPCAICGGKYGTGTGFSPNTSVFSCQFHSNSDPLHEKTKKKKLIIFITGLHNKPQGCGASVASAAGPFTTTKKVSIGSRTLCRSLCLKYIDVQSEHSS
jgi:hypothetical protein